MWPHPNVDNIGNICLDIIKVCFVCFLSFPLPSSFLFLYLLVLRQLPARCKPKYGMLGNLLLCIFWFVMRIDYRKNGPLHMMCSYYPPLLSIQSLLGGKQRNICLDILKVCFVCFLPFPLSSSTFNLQA